MRNFTHKIRTAIIGVGLLFSAVSPTITHAAFIVPQGGTGIITATAHGLLLGNGVNPFNVTGAGSSGQVLTSNGASADPTFQAITGTITSATAPISFSAGVISIVKADSTHDGYLSSTDWNTFNGKGSGTVTSIATNNGLTGGTITGSGTIGLATISANSVLGNITGASGVPTSVATSSLFQTASVSNSGLLSSTDWSTFNSKISGNQTITLSGDVSGSGTTAITTAIGSNKVTVGMLAQAAANTILGNKTGATANITAFATSTLGIAISDTTGTLALNRGGTGVTSFTGNQILYTNAAGSALLTAATSSLNIGGNAGTATALAANGTNCSAGSYPLGVDASGNSESCTVAGTGTVTSVGLSDSNSTLTIGSTPVTTSGTITATLNLGHSNAWTALQSFANASTSLASHTGKTWFGGTSTTTIDSIGSIVLPSAASLTLTGKADGCANFASGVLGSSGTACGTGSGGGGLASSTLSGAWTPGNVAYVVSNAAVGSVGTTTFTPNADFSTTGTIGAFVGGANSTLAFNLAATHVWTALQSFALSSTTLASVTSKLYVGGTATTTIDSAGNTAVAGTLNVTGATTLATSLTGIVKAASGVISAAAVNLASGDVTGILPIANGGTATSTGGVTGGVDYFDGSKITNNFGLVYSGSNVGIGTTTSPYPLEIASSSASQLALSDGSATSNQWAFRNSGGTLYIGTSSPSTYATSTQSAIQVTSQASTQFGIGTSTPWRTLSVTGTVGFDGLSAAAGTVDGVCFNVTTKEIQVNSLANCTVSSARYKHDIQPLAIDATQAVLALVPSSFVYNGKTTEQYGFIAEQVASTSPILAGYDSEGKPSTIDDIGIVSVVVKALQNVIHHQDDQDARITALEEEVAALKEQRPMCHI